MAPTPFTGGAVRSARSRLPQRRDPGDARHDRHARRDVPAVGAEVAFEQHRGALQALGEVRFVGEYPGAAATWDLALFGAWYDAQLGLLRAVDLARAAGIDLDGFGETLRAQLEHVPASRRRSPRDTGTAV